MTADTNLHIVCGQTPQVDVALVWAAPAGTDRPEPNITRALPVAYVDAGIAEAPRLRSPAFTGGEFELTCLESNPATLDLFYNGGRRHLIIDLVTGRLRRNRLWLFDAIVYARGTEPLVAPPAPVTYPLVVVVDPRNIVGAWMVIT